MDEERNVLQAVLIKVRVGSEAAVKDWLLRKCARDTDDRYCLATREHRRRCVLCSDTQLLKGLGKRTGKARSAVLPCEHMTVLAVSYLTGPFDFMFVARVPDCAVEEKFLVRCLRSWSIADDIVDTQTLTGLVYHSIDHLEAAQQDAG